MEFSEFQLPLYCVVFYALSCMTSFSRKFKFMKHLFRQRIRVVCADIAESRNYQQFANLFAN